MKIKKNNILLVCKTTFTIIVFLLSMFYTKAQPLENKLKSNEESTFTGITERLVKDYFSNLLTINQLDPIEQDLLINGTINDCFDNSMVRIYNDFDLTKSTQKDFDVDSYLNSFSFSYPNNSINLTINSITLSKIYYSPDFFYIKAEVNRILSVTSNEQSVVDTTLLDVYAKFIPYKENPCIYSIKNHEDNLDLFTLAKIMPHSNYETLNNDDIMFQKSQPIPEVKPGQFYITTVPEGATISFVDYPSFGNNTTPSTLKYPATKYKIKITKPEFESIDTVIQIGTIQSQSFTLTPTFSFLNFDVSPKTAEIFINGEHTYFVNGINLKIPKGKNTIKISADHFYSKEINVNTLAGKVKNINVDLEPKIGSFKIIAANQNAQQATIYVDNKKVGNIPLEKQKIIEGKHIIKIEKEGLSTITKYIDIKENRETNLDISLHPFKKVTITTNPRNAKVFIDNRRFGKSKVTTNLTVGEHKIRIEKDNYLIYNEVIEVLSDEFKENNFHFEICPKDYKLTIKSKPSYINYQVVSSVVNSSISGNTPDEIRLPYGKHKINFSRRGYFNKNKTIALSKDTDTKVKLFPRTNLYYLGYSYGTNMWNTSLGFIINRFVMEVGIGVNKSIYEFNETVNHFNINVDDDELFIPAGKLSVKDSIRQNYNVKIGYLIPYPIPIILNVGWGGIEDRGFYNINKAKYDLYNSSSLVISKDEYFTDSTINKKLYHGFIFGITLPITKYIFISSDYHVYPEIGNKFVIGGKLVFDGNR